MRSAVLNRATKRVADTTEVSGRVTAQSVKHGLFAKKQSGLLRICALTILGCAVLVGVLAFLAPTHAQAQGIQEAIRHPRKPPPPTIPRRVAILEAEVATLRAQLAAVQSNNALKLGAFVTVEPDPENGVIGPNITFRGANIHIVSGLGATDDNGIRSGLGNLIIGYDELLTGQVANRGGSNNLVVGRYHAFTSSAFGGLVAGEENTISFEGASVSGGFINTASGRNSSVSGGGGNTASGDSSSVSGGVGNAASGPGSSVSGGEVNVASGDFASVLGGAANTVSTTDGHFP